MSFAVAAALALVAQPDPVRTLLLADTARAARRAVEAQAQFERERRARLPIEPAGGGRCDERIGRFCYWYEDGDTAGPAEPAAIAARRSILLRTLSAAARERPANPWIAGQRVRYWIEQRAPDSALAVARECRADSWWCAALAGFAHHAAARFEAADSAFATALAGMPGPVRCAWSDWSMVLDEPLARTFRRLGCADRTRWADTLWLLAQPRLTRPGNELRTEFMARRVMAALSATAKTTYQLAWSGDLEEMMIRYGWSTAWSVADRPAASLDQPSVVGHQRSPAYRFWPVPDPAEAAGWTWDLKPERPRSRYAPVEAGPVSWAAGFQIARFPRGDSTIVVAAVALESDSAFRARPVDLALAAARPGEPAAVVRRDSAANQPLWLTVAGVPLLASIEAVPAGGRRVVMARRHFRSSPADSSLGASDPLFFRATADLPETVPDAARLALSKPATRRADPVGVYWEVEQSAADSLAIAVAVSPVRRGLLGRLGEGLNLVNRRSSLTLQWRGPSGPGVVARAFELDLGRLPPGRYQIRLTATAGPRSASVERTLDLEP